MQKRGIADTQGSVCKALTNKHFVFFMKISLVILSGVLISVNMLVASPGYSQGNENKIISLNYSKASLPEIFKGIEEQAGVIISYEYNKLNKMSPATIQKENVTVKNALDLILKDKGLTWEIRENIITVKSHKAPLLSIPPITIRGRIVNENNEPVVASVIIKGTNKGVTSDASGRFELNNVDEEAVLIISATNIETITINVNKQTDLSVIARMITSSLEEVVINKGYYFEKKKLSTGSVSKVSSAEIAQQPVLNPLQAIQGRMPGVEIVQSSGVAGSGFRIKVRGTNSLRTNANNPLYIIDGVPFTSTTLSTNAFTTPTLSESPLNSINPSDIESIEVLKDADATAIYGSRGANGVVLITTKTGKSDKTTLDVNVYGGTGKVGHTMELLNTSQYLEMRNEAYMNDGGAPVGAFARDLIRWDTTRYTDWQKELIGGTTGIINSQVSLSGGNTNTRFLASGNYYKETTVFPGSNGFNRKSGYLSVNHQSADRKLLASFSATYSNTDNDLPIIDFTKIALTLPPIAPAIFKDNGELNWQLTPSGVNTWVNPYAYLKNSHQSNSDNFLASASVGYEVFKNLNIKANFGFSSMAMKENQKERISFYDPLPIGPSSGITGTARYSNNSIKTWSAEPQINYHKDFNESEINVLAGMTFQGTVAEGNSLTASGYTNDVLIDNLLSAPSIADVRNNYSEYKYAAMFGRINYTFKQKYLLNLTARRDGSSRFGTDKQFANFGAIGVGWLFSEEKFLDNTDSYFSYGKLKASYGTSGNDQIPDYGYLDSYSSSQYPYQDNPGLIPTRLANADYSWETNKKIEIGIELGFLQNRFLFNASFYRNRSSNQLVGYALSGVTGFPDIQYNLPATVQNTGLELELFSKNIVNGSFRWSSSANLSIPKNKLVAYENIEGSSYNTTYVIGKPLGIVYKFVYEGVDPATGIYKFKDVNNDGFISFPEDIVPTKTVGQIFSGGVGNKVEYKGFELNFFFQFVKQNGVNYLGSSLFNQPGLYQWSTISGNQPVQVMDRWRKPGDITSVQLFSQDFGTASQAYTDYSLNSDGSVGDASFIRLKNVQISWQIPRLWASRAKLKNCRIYVQGQNLVTFTNYIGLDPENQNATTLPPLRVITAGVQIVL